METNEKPTFLKGDIVTSLRTGRTGKFLEFRFAPEKRSTMILANGKAFEDIELGFTRATEAEKSKYNQDCGPEFVET